MKKHISPSNNLKNLNLIINSDNYKLAHEDIGFLSRNEMRGVRMLLEITKPDLILEENKIDRGETLKNMAIIYMSNGEEDLSIETYEKALLENPKQPSCLKNIGLIYEKRGRYAEQNGDLDQRDIWFDKAAEVWSKAVRLYPGGYLDIENWLKNSGRSSIDMYL